MNAQRNALTRTIAVATLACTTLAACQERTPLPVGVDEPSLMGNGNGNGGGGGGNDFTLTMTGGVLGATQTIDLKRDNASELQVFFQGAYASARNMTATEQLSRDNLLEGALSEVPSCRLQSSFSATVAARDSVAVVDSLRARLVRPDTVVSGGFLELDKTSQGQNSSGHRLKVGLSMFVGDNWGGIGYYPKATLLTTNPNWATDWDDDTRPRVFELTEGTVRTIYRYGSKKNSPIVDLVCWNVDAIVAEVTPAG